MGNVPPDIATNPPTSQPQQIAGTRNGTSICRSTEDAIYIRDVNLVEELIGKRDFVSVMLFQMTGRFPEPPELAVVNAVLVSLMEHGLTPSSISARLIYSSSPDAMQSAVAAGLLGAGSNFLGSMEDLARILQQGVGEIDAHTTTARDYCTEVVDRFSREHRPIPGFGHHIHRPDDPRSPALLAVAEQHGVAGAHVALVMELSRVIDASKGRHITLNTTGAVAAVLSDLGYAWGIQRGFSLVARCAGLLGHLLEEQTEPLGRELWDLADRAVPYRSASPASSEA